VSPGDRPIAPGKDHTLDFVETIYNIAIKEIPYATVYSGASLIVLKVVLPELLLPPPMVIVQQPLNWLRKIDSHCVVIPSPGTETLYQAVK